MSATCLLCHHHCTLQPGQTGFCRARANNGDGIVCVNYGHVTSLALDPVEKKPLARYRPGSRVLSAGSFGCNLRCPFCQNHCISMASEREVPAVYVSPEELVKKALELKTEGNIGIAYTYNEPLVGYEYVRDCAALARENGLANVVVTNGCISEQPLRELLPLVDAMNIDLKGFTEGFYRKLCGDLKTVMNTVEIAASLCHVEVTTLIIPGENDSAGEMERLSAWLAGIREDLVLHVSRFFPRHLYGDREATPVETVRGLADTARKKLRYVYTGNC